MYFAKMASSGFRKGGKILRGFCPTQEMGASAKVHLWLLKTIKRQGRKRRGSLTKSNYWHGCPFRGGLAGIGAIPGKSHTLKLAGESCITGPASRPRYFASNGGRSEIIFAPVKVR